jgi:4-hydroxymandelate oxidase
MRQSRALPARDARIEGVTDHNGILESLVSVPMFEAPAAELLDPGIRDYVWGGAGDEHSLRRNVAAWSECRFAPRTLVDVSSIDTTTHLLGHELAHPILVAPTAQHRAFHPGAEAATVRGAAAAGAMYVQSSLGSTPLAAVGRAAAQVQTPWLFQLYIQRDRGFTRELVARAVAAGACGLALTVDTPSLGARDRDKRNQLGRIDGSTYPILADAPVTANDVAAHRRVYNPLLAPDITWQDLEWLVEVADVPVLTKGNLRPDDSVRAVDCGVAAVIVSNHGARNLDTVPATAEALPRVVEAVAGRVPVLVDGGIRRGTDVAKALMLGASAVLVGRPVIWGLTVGGAAGVQQVLEILRTELEMAMALLGAPTLADLTADLFWD